MEIILISEQSSFHRNHRQGAIKKIPKERTENVSVSGLVGGISESSCTFVGAEIHDRLSNCLRKVILSIDDG